MVCDISHKKTITNAHGLDSISWDVIADIIHKKGIMKELLGNIELFPLIWDKLAADFLNSDYREAYNSIKHGMRVKNNSIVSMSIGENVISGSDYGIDYIIIDDMKGISLLKRKTVNINKVVFDYVFDLIKGTMINIRSYLESITKNGEMQLEYYVLKEKIVRDYLDLEPSAIQSMTWTL